MTFYVKISINKTFSFRATLIIPHIVKDMCGLNDLFNNVKVLKSSIIYEICKILRYSLDGRSLGLIILFESMASTFLIYLLIVLRSEVLVITTPL